MATGPIRRGDDSIWWLMVRKPRWWDSSWIPNGHLFISNPSNQSYYARRRLQKNDIFDHDGVLKWQGSRYTITSGTFYVGWSKVHSCCDNLQHITSQIYCNDERTISIYHQSSLFLTDIRILDEHSLCVWYMRDVLDLCFNFWAVYIRYDLQHKK